MVWCSWCLRFGDVQRDSHNLPFFLYGESLGGAIALLVHLRQPELWQGVVVNGAMCGIGKFKPPWPAEHLLALVAGMFLFPHACSCFHSGHLCFRAECGTTRGFIWWLSCDTRFYSHVADCPYERYPNYLLQGAMEAWPCTDQSKQVTDFLIFCSLNMHIFVSLIFLSDLVLCQYLSLPYLSMTYFTSRFSKLSKHSKEFYSRRMNFCGLVLL